MLSAETSSRGYVITHQEPFLAPWKRNIAAFASQAAALQQLVGSRPETHGVEDVVIADIRSWIRNFSQPLVRTARADPAAARAIVSTGEGKRRVDAIRALFTSLIATETASSERQQARADSAGRLAIGAGIAGFAGLVLLILAFALYLSRTVVRPARRMEAETEQLEKRVDINRALLDASVDGIRLVDLEGRTLLANSVIEHLSSDVFGLAKDTTLKEGAAIAERVSDPASFMATLHAIADDPECATQDDFELVDVRRAFQRHTGPVRDSAGELIGRIIVLREITAEREAARLKSELVATVSHELRTPLTGVLGFAELLMQDDLDDDTGRRYVQTIHSEARRLTALVDDFLDVQKIEAGRFTLALESFELSELLQRQVELFSAQSSRHRLEFDAPEEPLAMVGDRNRIGQVIANLLSNAIKYSPAGGVVTITAAPSEGFARVEVSDSGLGIPAAQQAQVFNRFFRADSSDTRKIGGTGLGLALCHEIVTAHGGQIGFDSTESAGSSFWFELPNAWRASAADNRARVLVIEDDPALATVLAECLALDGIEVERASSGEAGLERAFARPPAVVCLDVFLPGKLDGWQVLARLKANAATARVPVIVCTSEKGRATARRSARPSSSPSRSPAMNCARPSPGSSRPSDPPCSSSTTTRPCAAWLSRRSRATAANCARPPTGSKRWR